MKDNRIIIRFNQPAGDVMTFYINPQNTPLWLDSIINEETNEWPIKVGTVYKNQDKNGVWRSYKVAALVENKLFELVSRDGNYHVRYTHKPLSDKS